MDSRLLRAPITALRFVGGARLVAGEGPNVVVYSLDADGREAGIHWQSVLRNHRIHGIKERRSPSPEAEQRTLAVFGGKGLIVLELCARGKEVSLFELCQLCELHDWIWDLQWLAGNTGTLTYVGLALGHNSVALYDYASHRTLRELHCEEKCILYSAYLVGDSWDELVVVAGTVFNQLLVWRVADGSDEEARIKPQRRVSGHDGVIFSICYLKSKGILASASDDRSIRVWDVGDLQAPRDPVHCLLVCYGHQSRVWSVRLLSDYLISIGEDSACIVWNYKGEVVQSFRGHKGRSVRAVAVHEARGWVATGGADTGVRLWHIRGPESNGNGLVQLNFSPPHRNGSPKAVKLVDASRLLVMTDAGAIYSYDLASKRWALVMEDANYQAYSLLEVVQLANGIVLCAMGNLTGHVKVFPLCCPTESEEKRLYGGKVHSLSWAVCPGGDPSRHVLFASGPGGVLLWLEVSCCSSGRVASVVEKCCYLLPVCRHRWHTSIAFLPQEGRLVCGDRRGSLMLFPCSTALGSGTDTEQTLKAGQGDVADDPMGHGLVCKDSGDKPGLISSQGEGNRPMQGPISLLFGLHGKLGVTSVTCHDGFIYSTGRDGCYHQLRVQDQQLQVLRKQKPCKGLEWIEQLHFTPDGNLLVLGFHASHFVLWSTRTNEKLHCVPCGGGHRSWSYGRGLASEVFAYVKSGDVLVYQSRCGPSRQHVLREPLHGRELTCVRHVGTIRAHRCWLVDILVTSSEDMTSNVIAVSESSHSLAPLAAIGDHISSVRALAVASGSWQEETSNWSAVLFSAGARAQIECYRLLLSCDHDARSGMTCQVIHVASHHLDEHWDHMRNKHRVIKMDPETRYMSIAVVAGTDAPCLFLAAACSDGSVRIFLMLESAQKLLLVADSFHHQRCVLKVETFTQRVAGDRRRHFLCSAATDGSIAFWDITATIEHAAAARELESGELQPLALAAPSLTVQAHSCGVNSLHVRQTAAGQYLVASGSDDGSIHICLIAVDTALSEPSPSLPWAVVPPGASAGARILLLEAFSRPCAHAAHVTGLRVLQPDLLVSASVDQRLMLWRLGKDSLVFLGSRFCHVADVAELDSWGTKERGYGCVLCGQGLEIVWCMAGADTQQLPSCGALE
ncbi:tRNA (34-2'-O)-methyltransferase regulator WDR6 isoform X2 [Chelonoidis abingdonii]|uniref:tRNA (34-2'-O)-methyltransferase regulator WDR6 isoform X2 n=1 Tax=Chelonoidis abingdonii TaxID=106734 RepID=UPI0013F1EEED|nr:WD repeat-containing protein 6 isoform X2 [Chelonoidis abingdonii]